MPKPDALDVSTPPQRVSVKRSATEDTLSAPKECEPKKARVAKSRAEKKAKPVDPPEPKVEPETPDQTTAEACMASLARKSTVDMEAPESKATDGEASEEEEITEDRAEKERIKRENHARFMRFSRSLKSSFDRTHAMFPSKL